MVAVHQLPNHCEDSCWQHRLRFEAQQWWHSFESVYRGSSQAWPVAWEKERGACLKIYEVGAECGCQKLAADRSWPVDSEREMTDRVNTKHERPVKRRQITLVWCDRGKGASKDVWHAESSNQGKLYSQKYSEWMYTILHVTFPKHTEKNAAPLKA